MSAGLGAGPEETRSGWREAECGRSGGVGNLVLARTLGVDDLADQLQLAGRRQPRLRHIGWNRELERRGGLDLVDGDSRVERAQSHRAVGGLEVEDAQVGYHPAHVDEPAR